MSTGSSGESLHLDDTGLTAATSEMASRGAAFAARMSGTMPLPGVGADPLSATIAAEGALDAASDVQNATQVSSSLAGLQAARAGTITILDGADSEGGAGIDAVGQGGGAVAPGPGVVLV